MQIEEKTQIEEKMKRLSYYQDDISNKFNEVIKLIDIIIETGKNAQLFLTLKNHEYIAEPKNPKSTNFIESLDSKIREIQKYKTQIKWDSNSNNNNNNENKKKKITKEELLNSASIIINTLNIGYDDIDEFYAENLWKVILLPQRIYSAEIYPSGDENKVSQIKSTFNINNDNEFFLNYIKENLGRMKYVEIFFIKIRKNSHIQKTISFCYGTLFDSFIMSKDKDYNIVLKGKIKVNYFFLENYFLGIFNEFNSIHHIVINVYFNEIDLISDFSSETDKKCGNWDKIQKLINAGKEMMKIRNCLTDNYDKYNLNIYN